MATWLEDFYKNNNIGGAGGNLSAGAAQYWLNEADKHGADKVKATIEGTAKAEGTWNQQPVTITATNTNTTANTQTGGTAQSTSGGTTGGTSGQLTTGSAGSTATGGTGTGNTNTSNPAYDAWYKQLTDSGMSYAQGVGGLEGLASKYAGTDIATAAVGQLGDLFTSQAKQGMMLTYDDMVQAQNLKHTKNLENFSLGNTQTLMGTEAKFTKEVDKNRIETTGAQNRLGLITAGEQTRLTVGAQADADVRTIGAQGDQDVRTIAAQGDQDVRTIGAQGDQNVRLVGAKGTEQRKAILEQGGVDIKKI